MFIISGQKAETICDNVEFNFYARLLMITKLLIIRDTCRYYLDENSKFV